MSAADEDTTNRTPTVEQVRSDYVGDTGLWDQISKGALGQSPVSKALSVEFDRFLAKVRADALRDFAQSLDLDAVADEWSGGSDDGRWSAGNAASAVQNQAFDRAAQLEAEGGA